MQVRWGVLGCGRIARKFATGLKDVKDARLMAAGSRTKENADRFGEEFSVPRRHGGYEDLAADPEVDAIYVATPHPMHRRDSLLCLEAGKAVLCEKPFTVNRDEARQVVEAARAGGRFLMEAMWTRFLPSMVRLREVLAQGTIGEIRMLQVDFGFRAPWNPESRLLKPELGGGGLLDVGVYTVSLAHMVFGRSPRTVAGLADIGASGVDEQAGFVLSFDRGELAVIACAIRTATAQEATIFGTEGYIRLHGRWWGGSPFTIHRPGKRPRTVRVRQKGNGFNYEAAEVGRCLSAGLTESKILPLDETLAVMDTLDQVRGQWGLRYPTERQGDSR